MKIASFVLCCWLLADLFSGVIHWWEDTYAKPEWPVLGRLVAEPNLLHHTQPNAFLKNGYWSRNSTSIAPAAVAGAVVWAVAGFTPWLLVFAFLSQSNEIHAWSHQRCGRWVRAVQQTGLLQSPREHGKHHRAPFDCRYCVLSDWLNPVLDEIGLWRGLETLAFLLFRAAPRDAAPAADAGSSALSRAA